MYMIDVIHYLSVKGDIGPEKGPARKMAHLHHLGDRSCARFRPAGSRAWVGVLQVPQSRQPPHIQRPDALARSLHFEGQFVLPRRPGQRAALAECQAPIDVACRGLP